MHMVFPATLECLPKMLGLIRAEAMAAGFTGEMEAKLELALEEALVNIIKHGYPQSSGDIDIAVNQIAHMGIKVTLKDNGISYNPLKNAPSVNKDPATPLELKPVGGYGIHLILSIMDQVDYQRQGDANILTLIKYKS